MLSSKTFVAASLCVGAALVACVSFWLGYSAASREGAKNLTTLLLLTVKPAVAIREIEMRSPAKLPPDLVHHADGAIYTAVSYAMFFNEEITYLGSEAKNTLCVIAKNREYYRKSDFGRFYSELVITRLHNIYDILRLSPTPLPCIISSP